MAWGVGYGGGQPPLRGVGILDDHGVFGQCGPDY
jgi:hypothetical protein